MRNTTGVSDIKEMDHSVCYEMGLIFSPISNMYARAIMIIFFRSNDRCQFSKVSVFRAEKSLPPTVKSFSQLEEHYFGCQMVEHT